MLADLPDLPISQIAHQVAEVVNTAPVTILHAPPGAGKSTWLPWYLHQALELDPTTSLVLLQPRRVAAKMVAKRLAEVAQDSNTSTKHTVGYTIRFENTCTSLTSVQVMTEGVLLRRLQDDTSLEGIKLVILDEFHERSLNTDAVLVLLKEVQEVLRPDLRILIMSATLDLEELTASFPEAPVLKAEGRPFPLTINYADSPLPAIYNADEVVQIVIKFVRQALKDTEGDVLAFLPGQREISMAVQKMASHELEVYPLYGELPIETQVKALQPSRDGKRKVIFATSIAETSLTIEGVRVVVDSGWSKQTYYHPGSGLTGLITVKATADAVTQRAGRAARQGPGHVFRCWTNAQQTLLLPKRQPEILTSDLSGLVLELANWGHQAPASLPWITKPAPTAWDAATQLLRDLGALDQNQISPLGRKMVGLPTSPRLSKMLLAGLANGLGSLAADVAALLEERSPLFDAATADLNARIEVLHQFYRGERTSGRIDVLQRIKRLADLWRNTLKVKLDLAHNAYDAGQLLMAAFPERVGLNKSGQDYKLPKGVKAQLSKGDYLGDTPLLAIGQIDNGISPSRILLAAPLDVAFLLEHCQERPSVQWQQDRLVAENQMVYKGLVIKTKPLASPDQAVLSKAMANLIEAERWRLLAKPELWDNWVNRVQAARIWLPELTTEWPTITEDYIFSNLDLWLSPYLNGITRKEQLEKLPLLDYVQQLLSWEQQQELASWVPLTLEVPSGSNIRLQYKPDGETPLLAVRLQELFGLLDTPTLALGKVKVLIELLSPGYKPVQLTQDLRSFWSNTYHEVKKELKRRYPKHAWPEDPFTAQAVRGVVKRPVN